MTVAERIEKLKSEALSAVDGAATTADLEDARVRFLGRSSELVEIKKTIGSLPVEEKKVVGKSSNFATREIEAALAEKRNTLASSEREARLREEAVDVSLPGVPFVKGNLHPTQRVVDDVVDFFVGMGYSVAEGPEVETDYLNFTALNFPEGHPARSEHDTFFLDEGLVMRTHTSPVQVRTMLENDPPVYVVCPGRTYRNDSDPTHTPMFNQIEALVVDDGISLAHLKGTLNAMARHVFGESAKVRLRPSFFPFTEPSVEMDVSWGGGWLELGGAGMVDPNVLAEVGYDTEKYTGFAFGFGPDRMAMVKYGLPDLRAFFEGDLRFLRQF